MLRAAASAGAVALLGRRREAEAAEVRTAGEPVEIAVSPVSRWTVRISVSPPLGIGPRRVR